MMYAVNDEGFCEVCGERIKDRLFDHTEECFVGRDERILFSHQDYVECLKEFETFMGPCPIHGAPDFPHAINQLHVWKSLLTTAKSLILEGIHQNVMGPKWTEECKAFVKEVEEIECNTKKVY